MTYFRAELVQLIVIRSDSELEVQKYGTTKNTLTVDPIMLHVKNHPQTAKVGFWKPNCGNWVFGFWILRSVWFGLVFTGRQRSCKPCTSYDRDVRPSVRLSVCLSVTRWHCVKTTQARITKSSPTDSPMTLVFRIKNGSKNSKGFTPSDGVKWEWGRKNSQFSANKSPYLRNSAR